MLRREGYLLIRNALLCVLVFCGALAAAIKQPSFFGRRDYPSANGYVSVADVNGDGIPDIIGVPLGGLGVNTLLGNGNGTFRVGRNSTVTWTAIGGGVPVDLNGDGKVDLVISGGPHGLAVPSGIGVCFGNGDGSFQSPVFYQAGTDKFIDNPIVGDFNGDGTPDVVVAGESGIWLFVGQGGGVFSSGVLAAPFGAGARYVVAADFNRDGKLDLAVAYVPVGQPNGILVLFGNGDGTFQAPVFYGGTSPVYITAGDLNGDGYPDIVVPGATIYWNNGRGGFPTSTQASTPGNNVTIGDVNGDDIPDLVSSNGAVAIGLGGRKFAPPVYYAVENSNGWYSVVVADLGKNGLNDIVTGLNGAVSVLVNEGHGKFIDGEWTPVAGSGNCGAAADFNGDGNSDLAVPTTAGIVILLGTGNASAPYTTGTTIPASGAGCPITGDVNGDGIPDLLLGASSLGGVGVYLGNGDGTFRLSSVIPVGPAVNLVLVDFNHDGIPDFADSSNELALGKGDGTFQAPIPLIANPPTAFTWIAAGDVNNDGWTDVLATSVGAPVYIFLNNQQGGFTQSVLVNDASNAVMLADLNGDGNLDAVLTTTVAYAAVYLGNGKGHFKLSQNHIPFPFVDQIVAQVGDVNGDGIPDLLLPAGGSIGIALGKGNGTFLAPFAVGAGPAEGQILLANLHGQSPTAGLPDLVAPDSTGGVTVLLNLTK